MSIRARQLPFATTVLGQRRCCSIPVELQGKSTCQFRLTRSVCGYVGHAHALEDR